MALVVLSRGHHGTGTNPPAEAFGFREDLVARDVGAAAEDHLLELGHQVLVMSGNPYEARHARAKAWGADVYVCLHLNSGYVDDPYGLLGYDHRSTSGEVLADHVARAMLRDLPELSRVATFPARPIDDNGERHWTAGMYHVIRGVYSGTPVGLCYEPAFIDCPDHAGLLQAGGPERVGRALAEGIDSYWRAR